MEIKGLGASASGGSVTLASQGSISQTTQNQAASSIKDDAAKVSFKPSNGIGDSDQAKIDRIKEQLQNGTYSVDSNDIGKAIVRDLL